MIDVCACVCGFSGCACPVMELVMVCGGFWADKQGPQSPAVITQERILRHWAEFVEAVGRTVRAPYTQIGFWLLCCFSVSFRRWKCKLAYKQECGRKLWKSCWKCVLTVKRVGTLGKPAFCLLFVHSHTCHNIQIYSIYYIEHDFRQNCSSGSLLFKITYTNVLYTNW